MEAIYPRVKELPAKLRTPKNKKHSARMFKYTLSFKVKNMRNGNTTYPT